MCWIQYLHARYRTQCIALIGAIIQIQCLFCHFPVLILSITVRASQKAYSIKNPAQVGAFLLSNSFAAVSRPSRLPQGHKRSLHLPRVLTLSFCHDANQAATSTILRGSNNTSPSLNNPFRIILPFLHLTFPAHCPLPKVSLGIPSCV